MRFLSTYTPDPKTAAAPPTREHIAKMGKLVEEMSKAGALLATGGLLPFSKGGARVRRAGGKTAVIDGPYTESKEVVAGFALLEAKSRNEVLDMTRRFLETAGDGECVLYQVADGPPDVA